MNRDSIVVEVQRRFHEISVASGYAYDVEYVLRNPEDEPSPDRMPSISIFELEDTMLDARLRGAENMPVYKRRLRIACEMWLQAATPGAVTKEVMALLKCCRQAIFFDGITLGRRVALAEETELSRVFRPDISNKIGGIGQVLEFEYIEDFSKL